MAAAFVPQDFKSAQQRDELVEAQRFAFQSLLLQ
jgi:hypothetical protein